MATANELFAANGEDYIVIDSDLRTMTFPASVNNIGVENDKDVHKLNFKMPRYFSGYDLSEFTIHINYVNANGDADMYYVLDPTIEENEIIFSWLVGRHACLYRGSVTFIVCLKLADGEGDVAQEYNTTLASLQVLPGLETEPTILETEHDIIEQLLLTVQDTNGKIKAVLDSGLTPEEITNFVTKSKTLSARMDELTKLPEGSTVGDAELADIRVGADGTVYGNAGTAVRTQITDLKNNVFTDIQDNVDWVVGGIDGNTGKLGVTGNQYQNRLVTPDFLPLSDVSVNAGGQLSPNLYDKDGVILGHVGSWVNSATISDMLNKYPTASKMRVLFRRADNNSVNASDIGTYGVKIYANSSDINTQSSFGKNGVSIFESFENGSLTDKGRNNNDSSYFSKRVRSTGFIPCKAGIRYSLESFGRTDILMSVSFYSSYDFNIDRVGHIPFQSAISFMPSSNGYFRILYKASDGSDISANEIKYVIIRSNTDDNNYMVSSDFMKRNLDVNYLGTLSSYQSFCVYDGYYYSTDGDNIYKQDDSFDLVDSNAIDLGHGNSLQLGSNGVAYASGWDDNKIYVVDLETLSVINAITLPTTGYTTSAVDDVNGIAYIPKRFYTNYANKI